MPNQSAPGGDNSDYWYIMYHPQPERIDQQLKDHNSLPENDGRQLDYLIPYLSLDRAANADSDDARLNNSLRSYLRSFVFIRSTASRLRSLVDQPWNRDGAYRLSFRFNHSGHYLRMRDDEMQQLKAILAEYQYKFGLREFSEDVDTTLKVRMKSQQFRNRIGTILEIIRHGDGVHLTVGIPAFNDQLIIELTGIAKDDVEVIGGAVDDVFAPYLLNEAFATMLRILRLRLRHQEDAATRKRHREKLTTYSDILQALRPSEETPSGQLLALRLLNASLLGLSGLKKALMKEAAQSLSSLESPATDEEALLLSVLFVATRKGAYRKAVKDYLQSHPTPPSSLQSLMPILKMINTR